jgi:hypothetical protein
MICWKVKKLIASGSTMPSGGASGMTMPRTKSAYLNQPRTPRFAAIPPISQRRDWPTRRPIAWFARIDPTSSGTCTGFHQP